MTHHNFLAQWINHESANSDSKAAKETFSTLENEFNHLRKIHDYKICDI